MNRKIAKIGKKNLLIVFVLFLCIFLFSCAKNNEHNNINDKKNEIINNIKESNIINEDVENKTSSIFIEKDAKEVLFGNYIQKTNDDLEPIKWIILEKDETNKKALILSKYLIDYNEFNASIDNELTWENSYIKTYVQETFYNKAFSDDEKTSISDSDNGKIFLLSIDEVKKYDLGKCKPTRYAEDICVGKNNLEFGIYNWWLRTNGAGVNNLSFIDSYGEINYVGAKQDEINMYIRPAIWVNYNEIESNKVIDDIKVKNPDSLLLGNIGDIVKLGQYEIDEKNKKSDIEWIIIKKDKENNKALLLSRYGIDYRKFSDYEYIRTENEYGEIIEPTDIEYVTWENSPLRKWLNDDFYNNAFIDIEKKFIVDTDVKAEDNIEYGVNAGNDTKDKVFILSKSEIEENIEDTHVLKCLPSRLVIEQMYSGKNIYQRIAPFPWWVRTAGYDKYQNMIVSYGESFSYSFQYDKQQVRPSIWVKYEDKINEEPEEEVDTLKIGEEGSIVGFGKYESDRDSDNCIDKIRWKVIYKNPFNKKALIISDEIIDSIPYRDSSDAVAWDKSYIRGWLNQYFYNESFDDAEKKKIIETDMDNTNRASAGINCENTKDKIFLLSVSDLFNYFPDKKSAAAKATKFAVENGVEEKMAYGDYYGMYMLRDIDITNRYPLIVHSEGGLVEVKEPQVPVYTQGVRPAMWVNYEDTEKDLSYTYVKDGYKNLFYNLFFTDKKNWYDFPLTDQFINNQNKKLSDEYNIVINDEINYIFDVNEDDKELTINVYNYTDNYFDTNIIQKVIFDYVIDDDGFIDNIILKKSIIYGVEPGNNINFDGPGKDIVAESEASENIDDKKYDIFKQRVLPAIVREKNDDKTINDLESMNIGDELIFGSIKGQYETENIKWTIHEIDKNKKEAFLISSYIIAVSDYDSSENKSPEWDNCTLRSWLNNEFINNTFSLYETVKILKTEVATYEDYREKPTITYDKVFLLSEQDVKKYFSTKTERKCWSKVSAKGEDASYWWLRNHSIFSKGKYVSDTGVVHADKISNPEKIGIRPAMWIKYE